MRKNIDFSDVKVPQVVQDVYADLRDRKLLPIVGLLLVAIVAVPFLLSSSSETPTVTETPGGTEEVVVAPEAQSAVLAQEPGLRDYQQRLDSLKASNPFDQQYTDVPGGVSGDDLADAGGSLTDTGSVGDVGSTGSVPSSGGGSTTAADAVTDDTTIDVDETVNENGDGGSSQSGFFAFRVDVRFGPEGDVKKLENVKLLELLEPVGAFIGGTEDGRKAVFAMSSDIAAAGGEGKCAPSPGNCDFLLLAEGQTADLTYQPPDGSAAVVYKLGLDEVRLVKVKDPALNEGKLAD